ncbi:MAG TPA: VOC family protein [Rhizomicrobium sp.]|nr:VOC family protein [Rhizomicrobium sp.]
MTIKSITPFLWFDTQAEDAANYYVSLFPGSKIKQVSRYGDAGPGPKGSVMVVSFELTGQSFFAMNGGPNYKLTSAFSLMVNCTEQAEIDRLWEALGATPNVCGWTTDKFGLTWQVNYAGWPALMAGPNAAKAMAAMMGMKKINIQALKDAAIP